MPNDAVNRFGLTEVFRPAAAEVDVVFVHGLNGHPHDTWTSEDSKIFWPAHLLPPILDSANARIVVYGYDADVTSFTDGVSPDKIHNHAEHLVAELSANRRIRKATERPIIFVAHSLGGLLVKRALIYSSEIRGPKTEHLRSIFVSTYGVLFLGTPHKGSNLAAWGSRLERICGAVLPKKFLDSSPALVQALKSNNETLQNIDRQFIQIMNRFHIYFFHEGKPTDLKTTRAFVVDEESASPTVQDVERAGIQADHSHMCKFESDNAPGFDLVVEGIQRYAEAAPDMIKPRWKAEKDERANQRRFDANELSPPVDGTGRTNPSESSGSAVPSPGNSSINLGSKDPQPPSQLKLKDESTHAIQPPPKSAEPYFIVPPGFRANTFFVGMEKELLELDRQLFDKRRRDGTACVLIHGQPGVGKSHLVRQYVHRNRKKFSGGIFWVPAKLREEIAQAFWTIYQKVVARDLPEASAGPIADQTSWVEGVKAWFEARHEWLMVFDGIVVDKDEDATALQGFIPDSRHSSIIYISLAKSIESRQRLLRPYPIKVVALKEDDARKLLFMQLHIKKPTEAENKSATELVRKLGGLPLAINAICHRLADTNEPLTRYSIKSYSADPKLRNTYAKILDELRERGHVEAWNLIHILGFFGQHIPMEMVHLGLRALRNRSVNIRASEGDGKPDINTTIGILRRYALIERNEPDDKESISSRRDSLVKPEPIDMLKLHSVVQNFCCDSLHDRKSLAQWLGYAVDVFIYSYRQADIRIKQKPDPGRVSDYRHYLVHGRRLREHSLHYESRTSSLQDVRTDLESVLNLIEEEIRIREANSSQESMSKRGEQISIFDRTSSSSESGPSIPDVRTPTHDRYQPAPLPLPGQNRYGFDADQPSVDSPASFRTASPYGEPRIVANSPRMLLLPYPDDGYESELEHLYHQPALEMQKIPSDSATVRPPRPPQPVQEIQSPPGDEWQVVPPSKKVKPPKAARHPRRDLGSFRPTLARPKLDKQAATGSVARHVQEGPEASEQRSRSTSDAIAKLFEVQQRTPPPSSGGGGKSFWQRRAPSPSSLFTPRQLTYADVLSGQKNQRTPQSDTDIATQGNNTSSLLESALPYSPAPPTQSSSPATPNARPVESSQVRSSSNKRNNAPHSSPLTSEFIPHAENVEFIQQSKSQQHLPLGTNMNALNTPAPSRPRSLGPHPNLDRSISNISNPTRPRYANENFDSNYYYSPPTSIQGPNRESLPVEHNVTVSTPVTVPITNRPFTADDFQAPRHTPRFRSPVVKSSLPALRARMPPVPSSSYFPSSIPPGYTSQPLSRQPSRQSHPSLPDTEPLRHHPFSLSPPPAAYALPSSFAQDHHQHRSTSILSDPTDLPKRPSFIHLRSSPSPYSEDRAEALRGTGGWASYNHQHAFTELSMSRSSSGPGIRIEGLPGDALGIVRFDEAGVMQFGEHSPFSIEDARRRTQEYDRRRYQSTVTENSHPQHGGFPADAEGGMWENENEEVSGEAVQEDEEEEEGGEMNEEQRGRARTPYQPAFYHVLTMTR